MMIGNFIADHIKGNHYKEYSNEIQKGIFLHREIDTYTDTHPIVRKSKRRLHKRYRTLQWCNYRHILRLFFSQKLGSLFCNSSENLYRCYRSIISKKIASDITLKSQHFIKYMR